MSDILGVPQPLRILILGGTGFIGPHMVRDALARGHAITLFNRGRTNTHLFPEVEKLVGDRDGQLGALEGRTWDVVLDNSGYVPRHVRDSAQLLKDASDHYLFTSTAGVYASWYGADGGMKSAPGEPEWPADGTTEDHPTVVLPEPGSEEVGRWYGHLKVLCEDAVREAYGEHCVITRPGLIVGPGDSTDRFTYYPVRIDLGGEVMAFGAPDDPVQYIDARDLAAWSIRLCEDRVSGTYNAVAPLGGLRMAELLYGIRAITATPVRFTWVPGSFLAEQGVPEFSLPPWSNQEGPFAGANAFPRGQGFRRRAHLAAACRDGHRHAALVEIAAARSAGSDGGGVEGWGSGIRTRVHGGSDGVGGEVACRLEGLAGVIRGELRPTDRHCPSGRRPERRPVSG